MRNGNSRVSTVPSVATFCSYRTYEEWKLEVAWDGGVWMVGSYRTYEEWKPISVRLYLLWGRIVLTVPMRNGNFHPKILALAVVLVLTVPMRNGNYDSERPLFSGVLSVLTVPMRNGNFFNELCSTLARWFLPYLWGMETILEVQYRTIVLARSYRTYEEWKPTG